MPTYLMQSYMFEVRVTLHHICIAMSYQILFTLFLLKLTSYSRRRQSYQTDREGIRHARGEINAMSPRATHI